MEQQPGTSDNQSGPEPFANHAEVRRYVHEMYQDTAAALERAMARNRGDDRVDNAFYYARSPLPSVTPSSVDDPHASLLEQLKSYVSKIKDQEEAGVSRKSSSSPEEESVPKVPVEAKQEEKSVLQDSEEVKQEGEIVLKVPDAKQQVESVPKDQEKAGVSRKSSSPDVNFEDDEKDLPTMRSPALDMIEGLYDKEQPPERPGKIIDFVNTHLDPFIRHKLVDELARSHFVTLYFEILNFKDTDALSHCRLLTIMVRFFDGGYKTRLLDLVTIKASNFNFDKSAPLDALKRTVKDYHIENKIVCVQSKSDRSLAERFAKELNLEEFPDINDFTADLEEILDKTIKCLPFNLLELLNHFEGLFGVPSIDLNDYKNLVFKNPRSLFARAHTTLRVLEEDWYRFRDYFWEQDDVTGLDPDQKRHFVALKKFFTGPKFVINAAWFHLIAHQLAIVWPDAAIRLQLEEKNLWSRVHFLNCWANNPRHGILEFFRKGFVDKFNNFKDDLTDLPFQKYMRLKQLKPNFEKFAEKLEDAFNGKFGKLIKQFGIRDNRHCQSIAYYNKQYNYKPQYHGVYYKYKLWNYWCLNPFKWIRLDFGATSDPFDPATVWNMLFLEEDILPAQLRNRTKGPLCCEENESTGLNNDLREVWTILTNSLYLDKFTKADTIYKRWNVVYNAIGGRDQLPEVSRIVDYFFALPVAFDPAVSGIVDQALDAYLREFRRVNKEKDMKKIVVKAAVQARFNRITESMDIIENDSRRRKLPEAKEEEPKDSKKKNKKKKNKKSKNKTRKDEEEQDQDSE